MALEKIISGGQTGMDRGALDDALYLGSPSAGGVRLTGGRSTDRFPHATRSRPLFEGAIVSERDGRGGGAGRTTFGAGCGGGRGSEQALVPEQRAGSTSEFQEQPHIYACKFLTEILEN